MNSGAIRVLSMGIEHTPQRPMKSVTLMLLVCACSTLLVCGCGEGTPKVSSADMKAFDGAAPELKQAWAEAHAAAATNNYGSAIMKLRLMLPQNLSVEQVEAVQSALRAYNTKLMTAADKDPAAKKVLDDLRAAGGRPSR